MEYRGVAIALFEVPSIDRTSLPTRYTVTAPAGKLIFNASSEYGETYALDPETAIRDARRLIDRALGV